MAKYNRNRTISSGLSKYNKIKDIKNMTDVEKLQYLYSEDEIDLKDPEGILLLNSGMNYKEVGKEVKKIENKNLTKLIENLYDSGIFQTLAQKTTSPEEMVIRAIDFNNKIDISTKQKTKTFSSISDLKTVYKNFKQLQQDGGNLFIFDTETFGGRTKSNIWTPAGITEFAMQEVNLGTGDVKNTNILMGIAPTAENREIKRRILKHMEAGNWKAIENDEQLAVTARRVSLYYDAEIDYSGRYATVTKLGDTDNNPWKNAERFEKAWNRLEKAYTNSAVNANGMRESDAAFFESIFKLQTGLNNKTAMALGQNFQIFDEKVINNQLQQIIHNYTQIAQGTKVGMTLSDSLGITQQQAQSAVNYINSMMMYMGNQGLNMPNDRTLDLLPYLHIGRDYFGTSTMYDGNAEIMNKALGGTAKQEYIGEAWFPDLFQGNNAHMADFDVTVLRYLTTQKIDKLGNKTFFDHLMTSMGTDKTGILGIDDGHKKLQQGQVFYVKNSGNQAFQGKTLLNYTYNNKTGEVFTNSGYNFIDGKSMGFNKSDITMGTNLKKGQFYSLESVKKVKTADMADNLGLVIPELSGEDLFHVQFKMHLPDNMRNNGIDDVTYNMLFTSEKELAGFMSSNLMLSLEKDENGIYKISSGAEDLFDWIAEAKGADGEKIVARFSDIRPEVGISERIQMTLQSAAEDFENEKAYNSVLSSDRSYKKITDMRRASKTLAKQGLENVTAEELNMLLDGKSIRGITQDKVDFLQKKVTNILGFDNWKTHNYTLYSNTRRSTTSAWNIVQAQGEFYDNVLENLNAYAKTNKLNNDQKSFMFNDLVESFRSQAALNITQGVYNEDARRLVNGTVKHTMISAHEYANFFDFEFSDNFLTDKSKAQTVLNKNTSDKYKNVMRINIEDEGAASYKLVDEVRRRRFGFEEAAGDKDYKNRLAFASFIDELKASGFDSGDAFNEIVDAVQAEDFNVNVLSRDLIKIIKDKKKMDPTFGFIKEIDKFSLNIDPDLTTYLNKQISSADIANYIANDMIKPIDSKALLKTQDGMKNFVNDNIMSKYMPSRDVFNKSLEGLSDSQKRYRTKLYDLLQDDISKQVTDILSITTRIEGMETFISKSGDIVTYKGGKAITLGSIPKIQMVENGHLIGVLGNQKLNLHLDVAYDEKGNASLVTNLGEKFRKNRTVSNSIRRKLKDGTFELDDLYRYTNKISKDLREQAAYTGTSGELLSNYFLGTKEFDKMLPSIFGVNGENRDLLESLGFDDEFIEMMSNGLPSTLEAGKLDPAKKQMLGAYRLTLMKALAEKEGNDELLWFLGEANASTKEKSKLGKDVFMGGGFRFHTGFTNTLDENSRPVIGGSGNVFYLSEDLINSAVKETAGKIRLNPIFTGQGFEQLNKINNDLIGRTTTGFTGRTAYVGQEGIRIILDNNMDRILSQQWEHLNGDAEKRNVYNFLYNFINTFEQAKVFDAEVFDKITGGTFSAQTQTLSASKDVISAISRSQDNEAAAKLLRLRGNITKDPNGIIKFTSNAGEIVKRGDAVLAFEAFGGTAENWVSKVDKGLLRYTVQDTADRYLNDDQISAILTKHINRFDHVDNEVAAHKIADSIFEELGYKAAYTIEDINKTTLPKILVNDAEKSMNQLAYMRIGTLDSRIANVLKAYGTDTADLIGKNVPTEQALRAYLSDASKLNPILTEQGFGSIDDFIKAAFQESYAANRMIFGKGGLFEGFVAIGNDNLSGHKNKGSIMTGAVNEAVQMLGKWADGSGIEDDKTYQKGLESIKDLVNKNEKFQFFKNADGTGYKFKIVNGSLQLESGGNLKEDLDDFDILDLDRLNNLLKHIDETYLENNANVPIADRLVRKDKDGNIQYIGRMIYTKVDGEDTVYGSSGWANMKVVRDSETQSGLGGEYIKSKEDLVAAREHLQKLERDKKQLSKDIAKADREGYPVPDEIRAKLSGMDNSIELVRGDIAQLEGRIKDLGSTGHQFKIGDRERNVLSQQTLDDIDYDYINNRLGQQIDGAKYALSEDDLVGSALDGLDKTKYSKYKVYQPMMDELQELSYYNRLNENELTKNMLTQDRYSHLKEVYEDYVTKQGRTLGVENAQQIYDLRMAEYANKFNNPSAKYGTLTIDEMIDKGFDVMTPEEYHKLYGNTNISSNEKAVRRNVILNLGDDFDVADRYIAVPGMGATVGDEEIKKKWHSHASALTDEYVNNYSKAEGDQKIIEDSTKRIKELKAEIDKDTAGYISKHGPLHERMQYKVQSAMDRTKIMSTPIYDNNPLFQRAQVDGHSIQYWRDRGVYHDAIFDDISLFKKRGFFDDDFLADLGMTKKEMVEHLKTHGTTMIDDRYPNIYDTSMTSARHYLIDGDLPHSTNAAYTTQETLLKILGDSDGDSRSGFVASYKGTTHLKYDVLKNKAISLVDSQGLTGAEREAAIRAQTIASGISEEAYDYFKGIDVHAMVTAAKENVMWHNDVLGIIKEDIDKTKQVQAIVANGRSTVAELVRDKKDADWVGKSILGREKYTALKYDPTILEVRQSTQEIDALLSGLRDNAKYLTDDKYELVMKTAGKSISEFDDEINILDVALQGVEELAQKGAYGDMSDTTIKKQVEDKITNAQNLVRQRVRISNYHNEIMSKLGISAVGNVNSAFYGATQAAKNFYGNIDGLNYDRERSSILSSMATVIEQSSISSKKAVIKAGDGRVVSLGSILNNIASTGPNGGLGDKYDADSNYSQAMEWLNKYADKKKTLAEYQRILIRTGQTDKFSTDDERLAHMFTTALDVYGEAWSNKQMRPMAEAYKFLGTGSANADALRMLRGIDDGSIASTIIQEIKRDRKIPITKKITSDANQVKDEIITNAFKQAREKNNLMTNIAKRMSNKAMNSSAGIGATLAMTTFGLAAGLIASGYASGNPLNDANPETVAQEQTQRPPKLSFGPNAEMVPNNTGGYIINIKGDTSKGNRQLKKALKQAANSSVGGAVNINMSLRTSQAGGYTDKDIENILNDYF
jgi:hypothetical protein